MSDSKALPVRVVTVADRGKGSRRLWAVNRVVPTLLAVGVLMMVAVESELIARGPAQFLHDDGWAAWRVNSFVELKDFRFASASASIPRVEVLTNGTEFNKTAEHEEGCVAGMASPHRVSYPSNHRFYSMLRDIAPLPPPVFRGDHTELCNATDRDSRKFQYCLPISGRKDEPYCSAPDRLDLLARQSGDSMCYGSVLHMLMADVYNELKHLGAQPLVVFGTLLGAVRDSSVIAFTEDADISYMKMGEVYMEKLRRELWEKGYHMFFHDIWRVCVAPTHPLAANVYDPEARLATYFSVPYVDLYAMERESDNEWRLEETKDGRRLTDDSVRPFAHVRINGLEFDTVRDPIGFLTEEYGEDFMTPDPR